MIANRAETSIAQYSFHPLRNSALAYAKRGWPVYPFYGIKDGKCTCGHEHPDEANGAHPSGGYTHRNPTCDSATIIAWFDKWPHMNFAVATGRETCVADYIMNVFETSADPEQHDQAMAQFTAFTQGDFRICGQVLTPHGTRQVYIELPSDESRHFEPIKNAKFHAKGSNVMGVGSMHQSGLAYQWEDQLPPSIQIVAGNACVITTSLVTATASQAEVVECRDYVCAPQPSQVTVVAPAVEVAPSTLQAESEAVIALIATNRAIASTYIDAGFKLCRIATGSKGPKTKGWQDKPLSLGQVNHEGLGLIHALSGTCAIDLDNFESAVAWFEGSKIDLLALLADDDAVQIKSGRPNRGKLVYRLPQGVAPLTTVQVKNHDGSMLVEFRCASSGGAGIQDVLPPTVHPDTGKPYEWAGAGDYKNLPVLPPAMLALWQSMLTTQDATDESAKNIDAIMNSRIAEGGRNNALFKLGGNMARLGMSPASIRAALKIENRSTCQPPLPDHEVDSIAASASKNSHGAKEAVTRALETEEMDQEVLASAEKAVVEAEKLNGAINAVDQRELPGVMGYIAAWSSQTARTVQPAFELCTALAACSSVLARDFIGGTGSHANLYSVAVGPSGCGKENALRTVVKVLDAYDPVRRAGKPASDVSVLTVMGRNPASTFVMDELGEILQSVFDAKAASYQARIGTAFMDLYTKGGEAYRGTEYGIQDGKKVNGRERTDIPSPCPSIFGATTAVTLFKGMSSDVIGSGFLPRLLYFRAPDTIPMPNFDYKDEPMPDSVKSWLAAIKDRVEQHTQVINKKNDLISVGNHGYHPIKVHYSAAAISAVRQAQLDVVERRNACVDELESTMLTRTVENASRVALTLALAADPWAAEVGVEHFNLALEIVTNATDAFMADIRSHLFGSKYAKIEVSAFNQMVAYFEKYKRAISERILVDRCKPYAAAAPYERAQAIKALEAQGKIIKRAGRNTNSVLYLPQG